jgi:hypothetical protein
MAMGINVNTVLRRYKNKNIHRHCIDICSYLEVFFIIKVYFPNLGGFGKIGWALKFLSTCDLPPAHPSSYFMTSP